MDVIKINAHLFTKLLAHLRSLAWDLPCTITLTANFKRHIAIVCRRCLLERLFFGDSDIGSGKDTLLTGARGASLPPFSVHVFSNDNMVVGLQSEVSWIGAIVCI